MAEIREIYAREILDSRGNPTLEVEVLCEDEIHASAAVPSGASTGTHEAVELRDNDPKRYLGKGVLKAVENVNKKLGPELLGMDVTDQIEIDQKLCQIDGTENKGNYGANAILGISMACAKAAAIHSRLPLYQYIGGMSAHRLPVPLMNILNGGAHANNGLDVQEFMVAPVLGTSFREALRCGSEIFQNLKKILNSRGLSTAVGDEGGFAPSLESNEHALALIAEAVDAAGYKLGEDVVLALDVASTEFYNDGKYQWEGKQITAVELGDIYSSWKQKYPIASIEDAFAEDDWQAWVDFTAKEGGNTQLVGDDLFVTNPKRIAEGIQKKAANALLVKINQIGTLTETIEAVNMAHRAGFHCVMSHRSGETEDDMIADLSVALSCEQIKTGSLSRGERIVKYNQLLRIEETLGETASFWGKKAFL